MSKAPDSRPPEVKPVAAPPPAGARTAMPPPPAAPPPPRNSPITTPAGGRRLDPAALVIGVGGAVLVLAVWWLLTTPRSSSDAAVDPARVAQIEQRLGTLDGLRGEVGALGGRMQQVTAFEGRIRALEEKPAAPDIRPLTTQAAALDGRLDAVERAAAQAGAQATALVTERLAALEPRLAALDARPAFDANAVAPRAALEALTTRVQELGRAEEQREAAAKAAVEQRIAALETALAQRIAALEAAQQRLVAIEGRTARLAAVDGLRGALLAGQPLGESLGRVGQDAAPPALARFATQAPPTEAGLRLSFEEAAKAARAASDAAMQPDGSRGGVVDSALSRLGGLVTVRRGDQVVWGDAAEAEIERARRALEAGDIEMSLQHIEKLPPPARQAMQPWAEQARALVAARAALRQLAAG